jgi:hypothetical protein
MVKTRKTPPTTLGAQPRRKVIFLGKLRPLTEEENKRREAAARDPKLTAGRRFPEIKD